MTRVTTGQSKKRLNPQLRWPPCPRTRTCQGSLPPDVRHPGADGRPVDVPSDLCGTAVAGMSARALPGAGAKGHVRIETAGRNALASASVRGESAPRRCSNPSARPDEHDPFRSPTSSTQPLGNSGPRPGVLQAALEIFLFLRAIPPLCFPFRQSQHYSHPRLRKASRFTPGGAYQPSAPYRAPMLNATSLFP